MSNRQSDIKNVILLQIPEFRGVVWAESVILTVISVEIKYRALGLNEITEGVNTEKRQRTEP